MDEPLLVTPAPAGAVKTDRSVKQRPRLNPLFYAGIAISACGDNLWNIAFPLLVLQQTKVPIIIGLCLGAQYLPPPLFALFAGAYADRSNKKQALIMLPLLSAAACFAIALAGFSGGGLAMAVAGVFALQTFGVFYDTTFLSAIPQIVGEDDEELIRVNARVEALKQGSVITGPLVGGALFALLGPYRLALADGLSFIIVALGCSMLPALDKLAVQRRNIVYDFWIGLKWLLSIPSMWSTLITSFFGNMVLTFLTIGVILRLKLDLHAAPLLIGTAFAAEGIGAFAGAAIYRRVRNLLGASGKTLGIAHLVGACAITALSLSPGPTAIAGVLFVWGLTGSWKEVTVITLRQQLAPHNMLGRVFSVVRLLVIVGVTPATILAGYVGTSRGAFDLLVAAVILTWMCALFVLVGPIAKETR